MTLGSLASTNAPKPALFVWKRELRETRFRYLREPRHLGQFSGRDMRLRDQEMLNVRIVWREELRASFRLGKSKPWELSNGSPESAANRPFSISFGKNALLMMDGVRR